MTNMAPTSYIPPAYQLPLHQSSSNSIRLVTKNPILLPYTRNFSSPFGLSFLQLTAPSLGERQVLFRRLAGNLLFLWEVLWSRKLSQGDQHLRGADGAADLIFSPFTGFPRVLIKTRGPSRPGKPRRKSDSAHRRSSHHLRSGDEDTWEDGPPPQTQPHKAGCCSSPRPR